MKQTTSHPESTCYTRRKKSKRHRVKKKPADQLPKPYQVITDRIIEMLEQGVVPWHRPWSKVADPKNLNSGKSYRGINTFMLSAASATYGHTSPYWITFKQAKDRGGNIRKGEKGMPIIFYKLLEFDKSDEDNSDDDQELNKIPMIRYSTVFNVEQCDGIDYPTPEILNQDFDPIQACEEIVQTMPRPPTILHGGARAVYSPAKDRITLPPKNLFEKPEEYYCTLFHELVHSTGHETRLKRHEIQKPSSFGTSAYAREELVAEMGAAFLCSKAWIDSQVIENSASYINGWIKRLKQDQKLLISAASQAQKAADYIVPQEEENASEMTPSPLSIEFQKGFGR